MSSRNPIAILEHAIEAHPALQAWGRLEGGQRLPVKVEVWRETPTNQPASVYRLVFADGARPAVFAKHCDRRSGTVERACYEAILPGMRLPAPGFCGSLQEDDGSWWLFVEDVGRERYSVEDPEQRRLAGHWIGRLHRLGSAVAPARTLPSAGPERYLAHLHAARGRIERNFANPALAESDREVLRTSLALLNRVEERWALIERACEGPPATLVHGDFQPKNMRVRRESGDPALLVLDWETAGWGTPAADLAAPCAVDELSHVDLDAYASEVCAQWRGVDMVAIRRLATAGLVFRRLAAMDWEGQSLHFEDARTLSDPVESLRFLNRSLSSRLPEEWLG